MISLYKLISEQELQEIADRNFKEFPSHFPLYFYNGKIPEIQEKELPFLVKFETDEKEASHFNIQNGGELMITNIEDLNRINALIDDKIKIIGISENENEPSQNVLRILEKEKKFFEFRLKIYLHTNNREIIPYDYFEQKIDSGDHISDLPDEEKKALEKGYDEKRSTINTAEEAVDFLINEELSHDNINEIRNKSLATKLDEMEGLFGLGMYLRNVFIYPNKNESFLRYLKTYDPQYMINRGEFGEGIIEDLLWRKLTNYQITEESKKKIAEVRKKPYEEDTFWALYLKEQLLSYNLDETIIGEYLEMEDKKDTSEEDFERNYYEQKRILTGISKEERSVYDQITKDYFTIRNLIEKLKHKP